MSWWPFGGSSAPRASPGAASGAAAGAPQPVQAPQPQQRRSAPVSRSAKRSASDQVVAFDPTALERGVRAMKELDSSPHAEAALRVTLEQERTKQLQLQAQTTQYAQQAELQRAKMANEQAKRAEAARLKQEEEARKTAHYRADLQRRVNAEKREEERKLQAEIAAQKKREFERQLAMQEESQRRLEEERRRTMLEQARMDQEKARVRALAEADGQIKKERENEDIALRRLKAQAEEERETRTKVANIYFDRLNDMGTKAMEVVQDPRRMGMVVGGVTSLFLGIYGARSTARVVQRVVERRLATPRLVRETSRRNMRHWLRYRFRPMQWLRRSKESATDKVFDGAVFRPEVEQRLRWIAESTVNTKKHGAPFRNLMLYGPPGTGKTLFARRLAANTGMDFAVVTGGDFGQLGNQAVTELHKLFDWAESSRRGTIIFIDEAEAFLHHGRAAADGAMSMSEDARNVMSAFLNRTGTESDKFSIVLATNVPAVLDKAVVDRVDQSVEIPLPEEEERSRLMQLYFEKYIRNSDVIAKVPNLVFEGFDGEDGQKAFGELAKKTEGFSGRQLSKLMIGLQSAVYGGVTTTLNPSLLHQLVQWRQKELAARGRDGPWDSATLEEELRAGHTSDEQARVKQHKKDKKKGQ